jgi:hypothetical protein
MPIEKFQPAQAEAVSRLIRRDLLEINSRDYPPEFIQRLVEHFSPARLVEDARTQHIFVASEEGQVIGTAGLANFGSDLYAGGDFISTAAAPFVPNLNFIAIYSGGAWVALAVHGSDLYVGGYFASTFDNTVTNLNSIARYNLTSGAWSALPNRGLSSTVLALASIGPDVFVGVDFGGT